MAVTLGTTKITIGSSTQSIAFDVYTGSTSTNTSYPVGTVIAVNYDAGALPFATYTLNSTRTIYVLTSGGLAGATFSYTAASSSALAGTWRRRGDGGGVDFESNNIHSCLWQRVS
jgi:hypothetical protein